jgi:hypothetical protein
MKTIARIAIGMLAVVGGFVIALILASSFIPDGVMWSDDGRFCSRDVLARQVSPDGARAAEHIRLVCDDGTMEHALQVGPVRMPRGDQPQQTVFYAGERPGMDASIGDIRPLRLWWESDERLVVRHQRGLDISAGAIGPVALGAAPYETRKSRRVARPSAWSPGSSAGALRVR